MEWWLALLLLLGSFMVFLLSGMPVAFAFLFVNVIGVLLFWGGGAGLGQLVVSMWGSVATFVLLPLPMFVLMGEVMFRGGPAPRMIDALDKWVGGLPGRLGVLAVVGGALFATMSGSGMAGTAMLGSTLLPEVEKRGYKKAMSLGPILASGGLSVMIPPTALGVILAALAQVSVAKLLMAIIVPGLLLAGLYCGYIIIRCRLQPSLAPPYEVPPTPLATKLMLTGRDILPLGGIVFLVIGVIFLGMATPSEAAALGALGCFILAGIYKGLNWKTAKQSIGGTLTTTGMMLLILTGSTAFSQLLAFTGSARGLAELITGLPLSPMYILIAMQFVLLVMGMFMEQLSIMMITVPIFMPIVHALGFDPIWFTTIFLLNMETALITPPFGLSLFVMKGVAPAGTAMGDIYRAGLPFVGLNIMAMGLIIAFPALVLWLPGIMR